MTTTNNLDSEATLIALREAQLILSQAVKACDEARAKKQWEQLAIAHSNVKEARAVEKVLRDQHNYAANRLTAWDGVRDGFGLTAP
jgi:hypothetical protein